MACKSDPCAGILKYTQNLEPSSLALAMNEAPLVKDSVRVIGPRSYEKEEDGWSTKTRKLVKGTNASVNLILQIVMVSSSRLVWLLNLL